MKTVQHALEEHKATDIEVIDVTRNTPFSDYYVLATAPNERALSAIAEAVEDELAKAKIEVRQKEGLPESGWLIVDSGTVVTHLFLAAKREEIGLEDLLRHSGAIPKKK